MASRELCINWFFFNLIKFYGTLGLGTKTKDTEAILFFGTNTKDTEAILFLETNTKDAEAILFFKCIKFSFTDIDTTNYRNKEYSGHLNNGSGIK